MPHKARRFGAKTDAAAKPKRLTAHQRGYDRRWRKAAEVFLATHRVCAECKRRGVVPPRIATVVDHIKPHRLDPVLFHDQTNWQGLCKPHHDEKTGRGE